jgi:pantothenate kinase
MMVSSDAFDTEQLLECVNTLRRGESVQIPIYDFKTHQRYTDTFRQVQNFCSIFPFLIYMLKQNDLDPSLACACFKSYEDLIDF